MHVLFNLLLFLPFLLWPAGLVAWPIAAVSRRLTGHFRLPFGVILVLCSVAMFYYLLLDHQAGIRMNFKYLFYSQEALAKEDVFLPSTTYWRAEFSGNDSKDVFRSIVSSKFGNENVGEIIRYLEKSRLRCFGPFRDSDHYVCDFKLGDRPVFSPLWRIDIEFDESGATRIPDIRQFFELLP